MSDSARLASADAGVYNSSARNKFPTPVSSLNTLARRLHFSITRYAFSGGTMRITAYRSFTATALLAVTFLFAACTKNEDRQSQINPTVLKGSLILASNSGTLLVNTDVSFQIVATGGNSFRFLRSDGGSPVTFSSNGTYTKRFLQAGSFVESGVLQLLDGNGSVVSSMTISSPAITISAASTAFDCSGFQANPTQITVGPGENGLPLIAPTFNFSAMTSKAALVSSLRTLSGTPITLLGASTTAQTSHQFQGRISAYGNFVVETTFSSGTATKTCQTSIEVKQAPSNYPQPTCTVVAAPGAFVGMPTVFPISVTVSVGAGSPVTDVYVEASRLASGTMTTLVSKPAGTYAIPVVVVGPGGSNSCLSAPITVGPAVAAPSCNFNLTQYPTNLAPNTPMQFVVSATPASPLPTVTIQNVQVSPISDPSTRWVRSISFPSPGVYSVEARVSNAAGSSSCYSAPVTVGGGAAVPVCTLSASNPAPTPGMAFVATLSHINAPNSGSSFSTTMGYSGSTYVSQQPTATVWNRTLTATSARTITGMVQTATGVGYCTLNLNPSSTCGAATVNNTCWYMGAVGESCTSVCSNRGNYNSSKALFAHTLSGCSQVLTSLLAPNGLVALNTANVGNGLSCVWSYNSYSGVLYSAQNPASGASGANQRRVCACNN